MKPFIERYYKAVEPNGTIHYISCFSIESPLQLYEDKYYSWKFNRISKETFMIKTNSYAPNKPSW